MFSRLCEEFPDHLPSQIAAEMERLPEGFLFRLMECRAYGHAHAQLRSVNGDFRKLPDTETTRMLKQHEFEIAAEVMGVTLEPES